jgi:hypothetical protein
MTGKLDGIRDDLAFGVRLDELEVAVGIKGEANIEAWFCKKVP